MIATPYLFLVLTFAVYFLATQLQKRTGCIYLNPILITVVAIIVVLKLFDIPYEEYRHSGGYIEFWLKPAIVALGLPLYRQLNVIRQLFLPIFLSQIAGSAVGIFSVVKIAEWLGASHEVLLSLAAKSVTTPIAIEITQKIGGIPSVASAVVICVGILGAVIGYKFLELFRIFPQDAKGISIGTASHGLGTAQMFTINERLGSFATLGLILNGLLTSLLTPPILAWMGVL